MESSWDASNNSGVITCLSMFGGASKPEMCMIHAVDKCFSWWSWKKSDWNFQSRKTASNDRHSLAHLPQFQSHSHCVAHRQWWSPWSGVGEGCKSRMGQQQWPHIVQAAGTLNLSWRAQGRRGEGQVRKAERKGKAVRLDSGQKQSTNIEAINKCCRIHCVYLFFSQRSWGLRWWVKITTDREPQKKQQLAAPWLGSVETVGSKSGKLKDIGSEGGLGGSGGEANMHPPCKPLPADEGFWWVGNLQPAPGQVM